MHGVTFTTRGALQKSALRQANERVVLNVVRANAGISRSDLARITGLSASSISFIVNRLIRNKMLLEARLENHSQVGRRPTALRLASGARVAVGVAVTAAESRVVVADLNGEFLREKKIPWYPNCEVLAQRLHSTIRSFQSEFGPKNVLGVGVGLPGTIDRLTGKVIAAENLNWANVEFGRALRGRLPQPFYFENGAKLSALAERWFVEPGETPLQDFVFVVPGAGLGTGIVTGGHLLQGAASMGGECGHMILNPDGPRCVCGNNGCWEQYASDRALWRRYLGLAGGTHNVPGPPDATEVVRRARAGEQAAIRALEETAEALGLGFLNLIWVFNPEAIVVGGLIAEGWDLMEEIVWRVLRDRAPAYALSTLRIYPSRHAQDSSLLGAVSLVLSHFFTRFDHGDGLSENRPVVMQAAG